MFEKVCFRPHGRLPSTTQQKVRIKRRKLPISSFADQVENLSGADRDNEWDTLLQPLRGRWEIYWNVVTVSDCVNCIKL
jgi:hypothetical protein